MTRRYVHGTLIGTLSDIVKLETDRVLSEKLLSTLREDIRLLTEEIDLRGYRWGGEYGTTPVLSGTSHKRVKEIWTRRDAEGS